MVMAQYERERARRVLVLNSGCLNCWTFADDVPPFRMGFRPAILASQQFLWVASCTMSDTASRLLTNGVAKPHSQTATNHPTPIISHFLLLSPVIPIVSYSLLFSPILLLSPILPHFLPLSAIISIIHHILRWLMPSPWLVEIRPRHHRALDHWIVLRSWGAGALGPWMHCERAWIAWNSWSRRFRCRPPVATGQRRRFREDWTNMRNNILDNTLYIYIILYNII